MSCSSSAGRASQRAGLLVVLKGALRDGSERVLGAAHAEHAGGSGHGLNVGEEIASEHGRTMPADDGALPGWGLAMDRHL